jgi:hypothetical protein
VEKQSRELAAVTRSNGGSHSSAVKELKAYVEDGFERVSDEATAFRDSIEQVTSATTYLTHNNDLLLSAITGRLQALPSHLAMLLSIVCYSFPTRRIART